MDPLKNPLVGNDPRLNVILRTNGYSYAAKDIENEEWLETEECWTNFQSFAPPLQSLVVFKHSDNHFKASVQDDFWYIDDFESDSDLDEEDLEGLDKQNPLEKSRNAPVEHDRGQF